jgi:hypothetical protein
VATRNPTQGRTVGDATRNETHMRSNLLVTRREIFSSSASNTCTSLGCIAGLTSLHGASTSAPGPAAVSTSSGCSWRSAARFAVSMARGEGGCGERKGHL